MTWQKRLPKVDEDVTDPKIHKTQYKILHHRDVVGCKLGELACHCKYTASYEMHKLMACENVVLKKGWWHNPWLLRLPLGGVCAGLAWHCYRWAQPAPAKKTQYIP
eukprot:TRINITY_DN38238_c0_g1_i1.p2 TRINITY_DN38238_c0_g1~~TRINITY_DN38238_c0_g1_i1.p2  ORF type:complete len:106 (+),score=8.49 TRINITY_DN38238_c0_g1_i1:70-387(+)